MNEGKIFVVTGLVGSGKTTRLSDFLDKKENVSGILTPVIENTRRFYDVKSGEYFDMMDESGDALSIGKYRFSKKAFLRAEKIIRDGTANSEWLVIDEIGPLELRGEGFDSLLKDILKNKRTYTLIIVIRESILPNAIECYGFVEVKNEYNLIPELNPVIQFRV